MIELELLAKFMLAATLKDCSIAMTFGLDGDVSICLIDLDQKSAHKLQHMCQLHEEIRRTFKQAGLERDCCLAVRNPGIQE